MRCSYEIFDRERKELRDCGLPATKRSGTNPGRGKLLCEEHAEVLVRVGGRVVKAVPAKNARGGA